MADIPSYKEDRISQIPALMLLQKLGYQYLSPAKALALRGGRLRNVLLEPVLEEQLRRINRIQFKGETFAFSEANIQGAVQALKLELFDGLLRTNEQVYEILTLGKAMQQSILGDVKSFTLNYVDWLHPENNVYHVTEEFAVERSGGAETTAIRVDVLIDGDEAEVLDRQRDGDEEFLITVAKPPEIYFPDSVKVLVNDVPVGVEELIPHGNDELKIRTKFIFERERFYETRRPDLVLFVNGIPFAVIECKSPHIKDPMGEAISQHIRNQHEDEIPRLFQYAQLLLGVTNDAAKFGTVGTGAKFWSVWKEDELDEDLLTQLVNQDLDDQQKDDLFGKDTLHEDSKPYFVGLEQGGDRAASPQDRALYCLCRPERLLELSRQFVIFDAGEKKIARYQQYFCVKNILRRIQVRETDGSRRGGVVWHTQGSGKSLTMVMLAKGLALARELQDHKIVVVTDRIDLDDQIRDTFRNSGFEVVQARSGWNLGKLLSGAKAQVITTVIDKFEAACGRMDQPNTSPDIFVLVDESHRTQHGKGLRGFSERHIRMKKALPNACYIGFTGTPLMKRDKKTAVLFGGLIDPVYNIRQAVEDKAVVPLLYEGRLVPQDVDRVPLDEWFEKYTEELTPEQKADLKRKCSTGDQIQKVKQVIMRIAWDVSTHYRDTWQGTPYKGQLATMSKEAALTYKEFLDEFGIVSSEVLISGPDDREGHDDIHSESKEAVQKFWKRMMSKYGSEKQYNKQIINAFKHAEHPEIIIVVDKLLTGFDAPRNTVLYLHKKLEGHTLLQAIARVNRLHEGKDFGYIIDYYGVLGSLDEALDLYGGLPEALDGFDQDDLVHALTDVQKEIADLPQAHAAVWDLFNSIKNRQDAEQYELLLADEALRARFYGRLQEFSRKLQVALSTVAFHEKTSEKKIRQYKDDLKFFCNLRTAVRRRYAETVDFREYEKRIQKLLDTHVGTGEVEKLTELVDIFDQEAFAKEVDKVNAPAAKADRIAHRTKKTLKEKWEKEDPAFYRKFSRLVEDAIDAFRAHRISDVEYLEKVTEAMNHVRNRTGDRIPERLRDHGVAIAFFGITDEPLKKYARDDLDLEAVRIDISLKIDEIIQRLKIVNWEQNSDVQNQMRTAIEDFLFEYKEEKGIPLTFDDIDAVMEQCLEIARVRYPS